MNANANGRVDILGDKAPDIFQLYDRVPVNNKITSYRQALTGNWENNMISNAFFSADNIKIIQNGIRAGVYKLSKPTISYWTTRFRYIKNYYEKYFSSTFTK